MSNLLVVGGNGSPDFAQKFLDSGYNVICAPGFDLSAESNEHDNTIKFLKWNRPSPISSRTLLIQAQTMLNTIDNVVVFFDAPFYNTLFDDVSIEEASKSTDALILGYEYFVLEFVNRITQKQSHSRIIFLLRKYPSLCDVDHSSNLKKQQIIPSPLFVSTAASAFESFAENIATFLLNNKFLSTLLVSCELGNEIAKSDTSLASWLIDYTRALDEKSDTTKSTFWCKAGSRASSGFSLFKR